MKILILHVPAGSGHQRAAEAVLAAFHQRQVQDELTIRDALEGANRFYRWCFTRGYLNLIHQAPFIWGVLYHLTDLKILNRQVQWLHRVSNGLHEKNLGTYLRKSRPDVVIGTHFFPMEVAGTLKAQGLLSAKLITVITDYLPHALWIAPGIDTYVVGSEAARQELLARGVDPDRIQLFGIPVDPKFSQNRDNPAVIKQIGLDPDRFTVLIGSGGAGTGPIVSLIETLGQMPDLIQIVVVVGKNVELFRKLKTLCRKIRHPIKVYGFINNMDELMAISNLMISKPGGLTCAEAMTRGLPLILIAPIPGQETRNAQVMTQMGIAVLAGRVSEIPNLVRALRKDPETLRAMSRKARQLSHPDAALQITRLAIP